MKQFRQWFWCVLVSLFFATGAHAEIPGKLKLLGGPSGAEVRLDGETVGELPLRHAVSASGDVTLELYVDGERVHVEQVQVPSRKRVRHLIPGHLSVPAEISEPQAGDSASAERSAPPAVTAPAASSAKAATTDVPVASPGPAGVEDSEPKGGPVLVLRQLPKEVVAVAVVETPAATAQPTVVAQTPAPAKIDLSPARVAESAVAPPSEQPAGTAVAQKRAPILPKDEEEEDDEDMLDLFIFETFAGPSFMAMALGQNQDVIANLAALPESELAQLDLNDIQLSDMVRSVSETGTNVGGAASIRLAFISLGGRLSYSSYSSLDVLTVTGELAFRAYADPVEFYLGFGLGAGFIEGSNVYVTQTDGLALRTGLGLNFRFTKHTSLGIGADAVGWFLAGKGIDPSQLGKIDQNTNHPIGGSVPIQANFSVLL